MRRGRSHGAQGELPTELRAGGAVGTRAGAHPGDSRGLPESPCLALTGSGAVFGRLW